MTAEQLAQKAQAWAQTQAMIMADLERVGNARLDAFDAEEYHQVLEPLERAFMASAQPPLDQIRSVRRAIRDSKFRPTYSELADMVSGALGQPATALLSGADAAARQVVRMPKGLPSTGENPARQALREKMRRLKGELSMPSLEVVRGGLESEQAA